MHVVPSERVKSLMFMDSDDVLNDTIALEEIVISSEKLDPDAKQFLILQSRV
jgi:hypothetical protein